MIYERLPPTSSSSGVFLPFLLSSLPRVETKLAAAAIWLFFLDPPDGLFDLGDLGGDRDLGDFSRGDFGEFLPFTLLLMFEEVKESLGFSALSLLPSICGSSSGLRSLILN